jgi:hypothetical protein
VVAELCIGDDWAFEHHAVRDVSDLCGSVRRSVEGVLIFRLRASVGPLDTVGCSKWAKRSPRPLHRDLAGAFRAHGSTTSRLGAYPAKFMNARQCEPHVGPTNTRKAAMRGTAVGELGNGFGRRLARSPSGFFENVHGGSNRTRP